MELLNHPVDMVAIFSIKGDIKPFKFKYGNKRIKVDTIINIKEEILAQNKRLIFLCMTKEKASYELKYEINSHKWFLYRK